MKGIREKKFERKWKRTVRLADKRGGILFNEGLRISQKGNRCVFKPSKKKTVFRFTIGIVILFLGCLLIIHAPESDRRDELCGLIFLYSVFGLPFIFLRLFRWSRLVIDNSSVVISYYDFGIYRKLILPIDELNLELSYNYRPRREKKVPSGHLVLSLVRDSLEPKDIMITSAEKAKDISRAFDVLKRYFGDNQLSYLEQDGDDINVSEDNLHDVSGNLQELPDVEKEPLPDGEIDRLFSHHGYVKTYEPYDHLMFLVWKWRVRDWLGYFIAFSISSLSAFIIIMSLFNLTFNPGVAITTFIFMVSMIFTVRGTPDFLSRYVMMDKLNDSLTYHPWRQSQWNRLVCQLSDIKALQLCLSFDQAESDGIRYPSPKYQLNLITIREESIKRINLNTLKNEQAIREQAERFADFLNIPVLDHCAYSS